MAFHWLPEGAELERRLRRVLAVLRAIAEQLARKQPASDQSAWHLSGRIGAIGRAVLVPSASGMDLQCLVLDELLVCAAQSHQFSVDGPDVRLNSRAGELMTLAVHELATNAVKYGALSQETSRVNIMWWVIDDPAPQRLHFEWVENGVTMPDAPRAPGFGSALVKRVIASELEGAGEMQFSGEGVRCTIEIPLSKALQANE